MERSDVIVRGFERIGAMVEVGEQRPSRWWENEAGLTVDVVPTRRGERFQLLMHPEHEVTLTILHASPSERHLVLMGRDEGPQGAPFAVPVASRFLCGHDERHWFAAVVPETRRVTTVTQAREALRPSIVRGSLLHRGVRARDRDQRRNAGCIRQGEWFFLPRADFTPFDDAILRDEPLRRGRGKPHMAQELYHSGGTTVYVPGRIIPRRRWRGPDPNSGLTDEQLRLFSRRNPEFGGGGHWIVMQRDPTVFARGRITHPDHRSVILPFWHRVIPNTESRASASENSLVFLD